MEYNDALKLFEDYKEGRLTVVAFLDKFRGLAKVEQDRLLAIESETDSIQGASA